MTSTPLPSIIATSGGQHPPRRDLRRCTADQLHNKYTMCEVPAHSEWRCDGWATVREPTARFSSQELASCSSDQLVLMSTVNQRDPSNKPSGVRKEANPCFPRGARLSPTSAFNHLKRVPNTGQPMTHMFNSWIGFRLQGRE